jgi:hypothetical protein
MFTDGGRIPREPRLGHVTQLTLDKVYAVRHVELRRCRALRFPYSYISSQMGHARVVDAVVDGITRGE